MNEQEMRAKVIALLREYPSMKRKISLLRFELEHLKPVTDQEILDAMTFSKGEGDTPSVGHISDKTYQTAIYYKERTKRENQSVIEEITAELVQLELKKLRLEYYVSLLSIEQSKILCGLYFEGKTQKTIINELHISESSLKRYREKAINNLTEMYFCCQKARL